MKMNKRGFTLIELLAVIVILAIIALIATPLILNVIDQAKEGAARSSAYGYANAVEKHLALQQLDAEEAVPFDGVFTDINVPIKGNKPTSVSLVLSRGIIIGGTITIDGYISEFDTDGKIITITKEE